MLQLRIGFPTGRYVGASTDDPRRPEWPPHPSRVFSALVAAAYAGGRRPSPSERDALERLEAAPPPSLRFPDADLTPAPDAFVPVNDVKSRVEDRKGKSLGVLMPNRQARQFPSAFLLGEPEVSLLWSMDVDDHELRVLDELAARVTHVGTSHSFVTARFESTEQAPVRWQAAVHGDHYLRVTRAGRLAELDDLADKGAGVVRRPAPRHEVVVPYAPVNDDHDKAAPALYEWVSLRVQQATWGADTAHTFARAVRAAALSLVGDAAPPAVHGHDPAVTHLAWMPLPDVGHRHAGGRVRGVAIALPRSMPAEDRLVGLAGLARLERVILPDGQVAVVMPVVEGADTPVGLREATWTGPSRFWSTVTPVLLDRPPKRPSPAGQAEALADSLERAGFPRPVAMYTSSSSDFEGAPSVRDVPTRIPAVHARVTFEAPITGPVLAGRWRNFGVGLFRPTPSGLQA